MIKLKTPTLFATTLMALLTLGNPASAQPPNRDLIPLDAWSLHGYSPLSVDEAFEFPEGMSFDSVASLAFNSQGHLIVLHRGEQPFLEFDADGRLLRTFGDASLFNRSHGLRIDADDNLWVTDVANHVVMKISSEGELLMTLGTAGEAGAWDEHAGTRLFDQPNEVNFDSAGNLYVVQGHGPAEPRVLKFRPDGTFIKQWGSRGDGEGQFAVAHAIEIDDQDRLYVADRENFRIQMFDTEGNYLDEWQFNAMVCGLYLHDDGHMYMTTGFDGEFAKLDAEGRVIGAIGSPGRGLGQFGEAHYIVLDSDDHAYISDVVNRRVQVYHKHVDTPEPMRFFEF